MRFLISAVIVVSCAIVGAQDSLSLGPAKHVSVSTSADVKSATPGQKISLYVDVTPQPQIHVYAPGADDYQPIKIKVEPQAGVTVGTLRYPKSELLVNEVERVPVFQKPFRLVQEVVLTRSAFNGRLPAMPKLSSATADGSPVTIKGTVAYQACDNDVCFKPESIPVTWQIALR